MFVVKLIAFLCMLVQANAYTRNEGNEYGWMDAFKSTASANQRNKRNEYGWMEGFKAAPSSPANYDNLDLISWTILGYTLNEVQTMNSQNNFEKLLTKNNAVLSEYENRILHDAKKSTEEKLFAFSGVSRECACIYDETRTDVTLLLQVFYILAQVGPDGLSESQAMEYLKQNWDKMSKNTRDDWNKEVAALYVDRLAGKVKNE